MRRSEVLTGALLVALAGGCGDEAADAARAAAEQRHAEAEQNVKALEAIADDAAQFSDAMRGAAKARVLSWGDNQLLERVEIAAGKAKAAHQAKLDALYAKVHEHVGQALDKRDAADAEKTCTGALDELDHIPPAVAARAGSKADDDRKALVERIDAAKRANEVMAKAKEFKDADQLVQARALVKSFDLVPTLKASPFESQVLALLATIPEKAAAVQQGTEYVIFDGSSDEQFFYFEREHDWTWKVPKPPEEPVLLGDNTESTSDTSTIWLGDETWGDLTVEVQFLVGDVGLGFHLRQKDEQTFDQVQLAQVKPNEWGSVRIELRGMKATIRLNGDKVEQDLANAKGKFGITLPPMALVKVRSVKVRLLDKDAHPPVKHMEKPKDEGGDDDNAGKKKKKKPPK
jgi:hypothetical protein